MGGKNTGKVPSVGGGGIRHDYAKSDCFEDVLLLSGIPII